MKGIIGSIMVILVLCTAFVFLPYVKENLTYGRFQNYFFVGDPEFITDLSYSRWKSSIWNPQGSSYVKVTNGIAEFYYNELTGENWGASLLLQGQSPSYQSQQGNTNLPILVGRTLESAKDNGEGAPFDSKFKVEKGKFWLKAKFKVLTLNHVVGDYAKGNVGFDIMCAINNFDYDEGIGLHLDVYFGAYVWNGSAFNQEKKGTFFVQHSGDSRYDPHFHIAFFVHEVINLDEWQTVLIDLGEIVNRVFVVCPEIKRISVRGFQVFVESIGVEIKGQFDYLKTEVT